MKLIDKDALVAEIEKRISRNKKRKEWEDIPEKRHQLIIEGQLLGELKHFLDTLEVKEVDIDKEINEHAGYMPQSEFYHDSEILKNIEWAKNEFRYFFELGMRVDNPITASDRGMAEEIIINLKRVENDYRIDLTKEIEWVRNKVKTQKGE